jgi:hypothetical protein
MNANTFLFVVSQLHSGERLMGQRSYKHFFPLEEEKVVLEDLKG